MLGTRSPQLSPQPLNQSTEVGRKSASMAMQEHIDGRRSKSGKEALSLVNVDMRL